ncbi:type II secretion system protein [Coraliomargarita parva]|uniref:type II secretion system protein n=1 Tax=Coraliomargarita parva TaxID=3014050 RepID=UPI0022B44AC3|nr:type II secretion system protein [Coraliomargarita parva]
MLHSKQEIFNKGRDQSAFTLIELLMVIAVVAVLAAITSSVIGRVGKSSQKAVALAGLRSVGAAIQLYANDHDGYLPGPLWSTTTALYGPDDRTLGYHLASYLELPDPVSGKYEFPQVSCPLFEEIRPVPNSPAYFMQQTVKVPAGKRNPWGYQSLSQTKDEAVLPQKITNVLQGDNTVTWAMCAADALNVGNPNAGWASNLLPEPLFGDVRLQLYFDWHVEFVPVE